MDATNEYEQLPKRMMTLMDDAKDGAAAVKIGPEAIRTAMDNWLGKPTISLFDNRQLRQLVAFSTCPAVGRKCVCIYCCTDIPPSPLDEFAANFERKHIMSVLVAMLRDCPTLELGKTRTLVLEVLCNMSRWSENRALLLEVPNILEAILEHLVPAECVFVNQTHDSKIPPPSEECLLCLGLLNNLAVNCGGADAISANETLLGRVIAFGLTDAGTVQEQALDILYNLACHNNCALTLINSHNLVLGLLDLSGSRIDNELTFLRTKVLRIVLTLTVAYECRSALLRDHPILIRFLVDLVKQSEAVEIQELAVCALSNLALDPESGDLFYGEASSPIQIMVRLALHKDLAEARVRLRAVKTLRNLAAWPMNRERLVRDNFAISAIMACVQARDESVAVRTMAIGCLTNMASDGNTGQMVIRNATIAESLTTIIASETEDLTIRDAAIITVMQLAKHGGSIIRTVLFQNSKLFDSLKSLAATSQATDAIRAHSILALDHMAASRPIAQSLVADRSLVNELLAVATLPNKEENSERHGLCDAAEELLSTFGYWSKPVEFNCLFVALCSVHDIPRVRSRALKEHPSGLISLPKDLIRHLAGMLIPVVEA